MRKAVFLAFAMVLLASCSRVDSGSNAIVVGGDDDGYNGVVLTEPYAVPHLRLRTTEGERFSLARDAGTPLTLVFFGYTHCPDICQIVMSTIATALNRLDDAERAQVSVAFVTTDPARDDETVLRDYLDQFDPAFVGLTGDLDDIDALGEELGVYIKKGAALPSGGYEVDHSTPVVGVADDGTAPLVWTEGVSSADLADDLSHYLADGGVG